MDKVFAHSDVKTTNKVKADIITSLVRKMSTLLSLTKSQNEQLLTFWKAMMVFVHPPSMSIVKKSLRELQHLCKAVIERRTRESEALSTIHGRVLVLCYSHWFHIDPQWASVLLFCTLFIWRTHHSNPVVLWHQSPLDRWWHCAFHILQAHRAQLLVWKVGLCLFRWGIKYDWKFEWDDVCFETTHPTTLHITSNPFQRFPRCLVLGAPSKPRHKRSVGMWRAQCCQNLLRLVFRLSKAGEL